MRIAFALIVVNTVMVQLVDPHFAVRVNDLLIFQHNAHVNNAAFGVLKKSDIANPGLTYEMHFLAQSNLLVCIARQLNATNTHNLLRESGTIYAENGFPAPNVRRFQKG